MKQLNCRYVHTHTRIYIKLYIPTLNTSPDVKPKGSKLISGN